MNEPLLPDRSRSPVAGESKSDRRHVIVVDDSESFRKYLVKAIEILGHAVTAAANSTDLETGLDAQPIDAVILDWHLHGQSSANLLRSLKERGVAVIVVTGDPDSVEDRDVPILGKPLRISEIADALEKCWGAGAD